MLLTFGKIQAITREHPILNPTLDKPMDFYNGKYYIKDNITMTDGSGYVIEPGFLEVYISYSSYFEENVNTEFYINYHHITNDGKIYNWRYYVHKEEETIYRIDKNDRPNLVLTKNKINNLLYSEREMEERFLSKDEFTKKDKRHYIKVPEMSKWTMGDIDSSGAFTGNYVFDKNTETKTNLNKDLNFNSLFKLFENKSIYIDANIHPYEIFENRWVDLFNLGSSGLWDDVFNKGLRVSNANGKFYPSHRQVYGINPNINVVYAKLGEYFSDSGSISESGKYHIYKIDHNTYLPGISYSKKNLSDSSVNKEHPRNYFRYEESPFYMVRLLSVPDDNITKNPIIFYGGNSANTIYENHYDVKNESINLISEEIYGIRNTEIPKQWEMGMLLTTVHEKNDINELLVDSKNNIQSKLLNYTTYKSYLDKSNLDWGLYHINENTNSIFKDDLHIHLFDTDPNKVYYRMHSIDVDNDNYIRRITDLINNSDVVTDIKLGPEVRTVFDKTEINLNDENRFINIVNEDMSMALTYFKAEINKRSPRYTLENQSLSYEIAYPEQQTFLTRMNKRLSLKDNEKLAIDKITVGFRPILVKINNRWKHLTKKGLGR